LQSEGIAFSAIITRNSIKTWAGDSFGKSDGIYYFMQGDRDAAYWLSDLKMLCVHEHPRLWDKGFIDTCMPI